MRKGNNAFQGVSFIRPWMILIMSINEVGKKCLQLNVPALYSIKYIQWYGEGGRWWKLMKKYCRYVYIIAKLIVYTLHLPRNICAALPQTKNIKHEEKRGSFYPFTSFNVSMEYFIIKWKLIYLISNMLNLRVDIITQKFNYVY